jgi:methionine synthase II (cobalamin-independent)
VSKFVKLHVEEVIICNNAPMDFIPEVIAVRKLRKLSRVTERLVVTGGKAY